MQASESDLSKLVFRLVAVLPRTLEDVRGLPFALEVVEELGIGEEQGEEVVNIQAEVPEDDDEYSEDDDDDDDKFLEMISLASLLCRQIS